MPGITEAGKTISKKNMTGLAAAFRALKAVLRGAGYDPDEDEAETDPENPVTEAALSFADRQGRIGKALRDTGISYPYLRDVFDQFFVYSGEGYGSGKQYAQAYAIDNKGQVTLGSRVEVLSRTEYETLDGTSLTADSEVTTTEAALEDLTELVTLREGKSTDTTIPIKLITPGMGSSGYYLEEVLQRDGPKVFTKGLPMFWNHDSPTQEAERPEGDMDRLAAVLTTDARWEDKGVEGPGLYARMKVFSDYGTRIQEKGPHTGLSINAGGRKRIKEIPGLGKVPVIESIVRAKSVDFVTKPGAGGKALVPLLESALDKGDPTMADPTNDLTEIVEAQRVELVNLRRSLEAGKATPIITAALQAYNFPQRAATRVREAVMSQLSYTDEGLLDTNKLQETIQTVATGEADYLGSFGLGQVRGMGGTGSGSNGSTPTLEAAQANLDAVIKRLNG